ncbi:MAG: YhgE/Pip domain-containing protein, partial [Brachybacterium sp.]|nr:YhgE/Pip domain-containing protein [Brachybacterium sp.]
DGLDQLADGADELAGGLGQLEEGISGTDGQPGLVEGVGLLGDGLRGDGTAQNPGLVGGTQQLAESTDDLADGVELALAGDGTAQNPGAIAGTRSLADGLQGLSDAADGEGDLAGSGGDLLAQCAAELGEDSELCQELGAYVEGASQYQGEVTATLEGSDQQPGLITGARRTADGLEVLADGDGTAENPGLVPATRQFADGAQELAEQAPQVIAGVDDLESQVGQLSEATGQLADGADQLAAGTRESADGARDLADGASGLASGVRETRDGVDDLADGTDQLASGARDLSSGAGALGDGADELADGTQGLAGGARELADGTDGLAAGTEEIAGGTRELAEGAGQLADGSEELADGTSDLADGLQEGADEVPTYDEAERERMSEMAAQPVGSFTERQNEAAGASTAIFPFVAGLALWLGAFAIYIFLPALSQRFLDRAMPMWMVVLRSLAPAVILGAVQSVMVLAVMTAAGVRPTSPIGVAVVAFAGAIAFAAFHQAVLATLGNRMGRIASLVLLVLQMVVLVGVLPLETAPAPLQAISSFMPLTILSEGLVHASLGGSLVSTTETLAELGAGTLLAVAITLIASRGARDESRRDQVAETDAVPA